MNQRLYGFHPPVGVGDLVAGPDGEDGHRGEYAAQHNEQDGNEGPPAEAPTAGSRGGLLAAEFSRLGAEALELGSLVGADPVLRTHQPIV
jgi:hypothetical protein